MDADSSFYVKFIATEVPTFFGYIILVLAMVSYDFHSKNVQIILPNYVVQKQVSDIIVYCLRFVTCFKFLGIALPLILC